MFYLQKRILRWFVGLPAKNVFAGVVLPLLSISLQKLVNPVLYMGWLGGSVVERRSLTGELSLVCTGPAADGSTFIWVNRPL